MPSILTQLSQLSEVGVRIPAFPAAALPAGLARFADVLTLDGNTSPHEDAYQAGIERWCDRIEALYCNAMPTFSSPIPTALQSA